MMYHKNRKKKPKRRTVQQEIPFPDPDPAIVKADRIRQGNAIVQRLIKKYS
jgi:hypothetical protein